MKQSNQNLPAMPWKRWTAQFIPCLPSIGKRTTCLLALTFCGWSSPAAAQQAATPTTIAPDQPTAVSNAPVQPALKVPDIPATFKHPGLLNSMEELQFIKKKIAAGEEPWKSAFEQMKATKFAALNYKPHPHETVGLGILGEGGAAIGTFDEDEDAKGREADRRRCSCLLACSCLPSACLCISSPAPASKLRGTALALQMPQHRGQRRQSSVEVERSHPARRAEAERGRD